jgi:hypothetical protein
MADQPFVPLHRRPDEVIEAALRLLSAEIEWPVAATSIGGPDIAAAVAARLVEAGRGSAESAPRVGRAWRRWTWSPARRALVVAIIALIAFAAIVGAGGFGLPGLRILFGGPSPSPTLPSATPNGGPSPSASHVLSTPVATAARTAVPGPPGSGLGLGTKVALADIDPLAGFEVHWPSDPPIGPPDAAWLDPALNDQVALVWAASDRLPATNEPGVGLILTQFRGTVEDGWFTKILGPDTTVELVRVGGLRGYWITGQPHQFFYEGPNGFVDETRRFVGDVLLWADGPITYRLETSLGRDAALAIAESMP